MMNRHNIMCIDRYVGLIDAVHITLRAELISEKR